MDLPVAGLLGFVASLLKRMTRLALSVGLTGARCHDRRIFEYRDGTSGPGIKLRLLIRNESRFSDIADCQVLVTRIESPSGVLLEGESSRLIWSLEYTRSEWLTPKLILRGDVGARYVDLCSAEERDQCLQIMSERYEGGDHRFTESGIYAIRVQLIVPSRRRCKEIRVRVSYDQSNWASTRMLDAS